MNMKRNKSNSKDRIDEIAFISATTKFLSDDQYLKDGYTVSSKIGLTCLTHLVTLKTRRSLRALKAESPKDPARSLRLTQTTSNIEPTMTIQSKRLKEEEK